MMLPRVPLALLFISLLVYETPTVFAEPQDSAHHGTGGGPMPLLGSGSPQNGSVGGGQMLGSAPPATQPPWNPGGGSGGNTPTSLGTQPQDGGNFNPQDMEVSPLAPQAPEQKSTSVSSMS